MSVSCGLVEVTMLWCYTNVFIIIIIIIIIAVKIFMSLC